MFRFAVYGSVNNARKRITICLTDYADVAEYLMDNVAKALDPDGTSGLTVEVVERAEASTLIRRERENETEEEADA